jgi:hypothetical protein
MNRFFFWILSCILPFLFISCQEKARMNQPVRTAIFSVKTLIDEQVKELKSWNFTIDKTTLINGKKEEIFFNPDTAFWTKEFEIFATADIGKPSMRDRFILQESDSSGYHYVKYEAVDPDINGTRSLLLCLDSAGTLKGITILHQEDNFIYQSNRILRMNFSRDLLPHGNLLTMYSIKGYQKIIFRDPVNYEIEAKVNPAVSGR